MLSSRRLPSHHTPVQLTFSWRPRSNPSSIWKRRSLLNDPFYGRRAGFVVELLWLPETYHYQALEALQCAVSEASALADLADSVRKPGSAT